MFDYLRNYKDFFGATHVFGIVTTMMRHWNFVWLPESDELSQSLTLPVADPTPFDPDLILEQCAHRLSTGRMARPCRGC